jgi:serine/threonine protein kinase
VRWRSRSCPTKVSADAERRARFNSEAKAVAALSHPNILAIHDFGDHDGAAYAVMELLEGQTLRERLSGGGRCRPAKRERSAPRARAAWPPLTRRASSTAT